MDDYFTRKLTVLYLWFYDWTGIYVATIATFAAILSHFFFRPFTWFNILIIIPNIIVVIPQYILQDRANYTAYNIQAMALASNRLRQIASASFVFISIFEFVAMTIFYLVDKPEPAYRMFSSCWNTLMLTLYLQIMTVPIREREPKSWFKSPDLAMEKSS